MVYFSKHSSFLHNVNYLKKYERQSDVERWVTAILNFIRFVLIELNVRPMTKFKILSTLIANLGQIKSGRVYFVVEYMLHLERIIVFHMSSFVNMNNLLSNMSISTCVLGAQQNCLICFVFLSNYDPILAKLHRNLWQIGIISRVYWPDDLRWSYRPLIKLVRLTVY